MKTEAIAEQNPPGMSSQIEPLAYMIRNSPRLITSSSTGQPWLNRLHLWVAHESRWQTGYRRRPADRTQERPCRPAADLGLQKRVTPGPVR